MFWIVKSREKDTSWGPKGTNVQRACFYLLENHHLGHLIQATPGIWITIFIKISSHFLRLYGFRAVALKRCSFGLNKLEDFCVAVLRGCGSAKTLNSHKSPWEDSFTKAEQVGSSLPGSQALRLSNRSIRLVPKLRCFLRLAIKFKCLWGKRILEFLRPLAVCVTVEVARAFLQLERSTL